MAKNNNLTDFLTDVAEAIRSKKGTTAKINPQDFSSEIASIETGGTTNAISKSDVNFYDCDGTLLHSYTKDAFLALSVLPDLPTREGLTCQGWNYTLANAREYVNTYGLLDIGATYITDDGKTRLYIKTTAKGRMDVPICFSQTVSNGVTIDWGDGSETQTVSGTWNVNASHTYADIGEYVISLDPASGCTLGLGHTSSSYCVMGATGSYGLVYCNMLQAVEIGKNVTSIGSSAFYKCYSLASIVIPKGVIGIGTNVFYHCYSLASVVFPSSVTSIGDYSFYYCYSLERVVIPKGVTNIGGYSFYFCYSLESVVFPSSVTSIGDSMFYYCYTLTNVVIPSSVTSIGSKAFNNCYTLASVVIPKGVTNIGAYAFNNCYTLTSVVIPSSVTSISSSMFNNCYTLTSVVIPSSVTSIGSKAFYACYGMAYYDFRASTSVPTLSNSDAFSYNPSDRKIVVPDSLYDSWITATNWSTYASNIVKASEFNG